MKINPKLVVLLSALGLPAAVLAHGVTATDFAEENVPFAVAAGLGC